MKLLVGVLLIATASSLGEGEANVKNYGNSSNNVLSLNHSLIFDEKKIEKFDNTTMTPFMNDSFVFDEVDVTKSASFSHFHRPSYLSSYHSHKRPVKKPVPPQGPYCVANAFYTSCKSVCRDKCPNSGCTVTLGCTPGCNCNNGYVADNDGSCVPVYPYCQTREVVVGPIDPPAPEQGTSGIGLPVAPAQPVR